MNNLNERLSSLGSTNVKLAEIAGVTKQSVTNWISRDSLSKKGAERLAKHFGVSMEWLLTGKIDKNPNTESSSFLQQRDLNQVNEKPSSYDKNTSLFPKQQSNAEFIGGMEPWNSKTELTDDEVEIPFFTEVELAAGNGMISTQEHKGFKLRFARSTLKRHGVDVAYAACVKVSGSSMEPVLPDNSTIGIDTAKTNISDGKMFALDHDGMLRVKVVYKVPGGGIRLKSFNSDEYPDETYSKTESQLIRIIGKVFWYSVLI